MAKVELENLLKSGEFISSQEIFKIYEGFITPPKTKPTEDVKLHTQDVYKSYLSTFGMDLQNKDPALTGKNIQAILYSTYLDIKQKSPLQAHEWYVLQESLRWFLGKNYRLQIQPRRSDPKIILTDINIGFSLPDGALSLNTLTDRIKNQLTYSSQKTNQVGTTTTINNLLLLLSTSIGGDFYGLAMSNNDLSRYTELNQALNYLPFSTPEYRKVYGQLKNLLTNNQLFLTKEGIKLFQSPEANYLLNKIPGFGAKQLEWTKSALHPSHTPGV